jgi:hypothetical protein
MADRYAVVIQIDAESVRALASAVARVVLAKESPTGRSNVAWLTWEPRAVSVVTWDEKYGLYAASAAQTAETALRITAMVFPAVERTVCSYRNGSFVAPVADGGIPPRHFDVRNESDQPATFGLVQTASVDGLSTCGPINAAVVPAGFAADFTPLTTLRIWAQQAVGNGAIVNVPEDAARVHYEGVRKTIYLRYDHRDGRFQVATHREPAVLERRPIVTWRVEPLASSIYQEGYTNCGPASVEIVLNALGRKTPPGAVQTTLEGSINTWLGPWGKDGSNPAGVALTINRYAPESSYARRSHEVSYSTLPYDACSRMINALRAYQSPSVALVFWGTHWVVVVGAEGSGTPEAGADYSISALWVCNPGTRMKFEHITYAAWLYEYFTGCMQYPVEQFVAVSDARAAVVGTLRLPPPEPLPGLLEEARPDPVKSALAGLAAHGLSDMITSEMPVDYHPVTNPSYMSPPPGQGFLPFALVAFWGLPDDAGEATWTVVRVDAKWGTYLGATFGIQVGGNIGPTFESLPLDVLLEGAETEEGRRRVEALHGSDREIRQTLTWQPGNASRSPFAPFREITDGIETIYLTADRRVLTDPT